MNAPAIFGQSHDHFLSFSSVLSYDYQQVKITDYRIIERHLSECDWLKIKCKLVIVGSNSMHKHQ